ncbi:MAG: aminotransferase class V-fold PLP-dependent enzyme [Pseudomonadota bacterium]
MITPDLLTEIRSKFAHVDTCPFQGPRVFFENAGGALTLNSVVETSARFAAIPDNQGRDNPAAHALVDIIKDAKAAAMDWFNAPGGQVFVGESGTELLFRLVRTAVTGTSGGVLLGSTVEHPATRSAMGHWAEKFGRDYRLVAHDDALGLVTAEAYAAAVTPDTKVATILHTSPVTGMGMDLAAIAVAIRAVAPECFIIVDGIQHASHGLIDLTAADVDGYVISGYKVFGRHGYGVAWVSDRLTALGPEQLAGGPEMNWEMGTRDTGAYATFHDVIDYFDWLGGAVSDANTRRDRIEAAGAAIKAHEKALTDAMLQGAGNLKGLADYDKLTVVGGVENAAREGLVCFYVDGRPAAEIVAALNAEGVRTHVRKADHYSGNILTPLGQDAAVRVSLCHYNSEAEVARLLSVMADIMAD